MRTGDLIPRGEDLIFEVELLGAVPNYQKGMGNMFKVMDHNMDGVIQREEVSPNNGRRNIISRQLKEKENMTVLPFSTKKSSSS